MEIKFTKVSILLVDKVQNILRIQRAALHCIAIKSNTCVLVDTLAKNKSQKL